MSKETAPSAFGVIVTVPVLSCVTLNKASTFVGAVAVDKKSRLPKSSSVQLQIAVTINIALKKYLNNFMFLYF